MNIDEVRANKPDVATHYHKTKYGVIYLKEEKHLLFFKKWMNWSDALLIWTECYIHKKLEIKPLH